MHITKVINSYGIKEAAYTYAYASFGELFAWMLHFRIGILDKIFESDNINERMELCDELIDELLFNDIEVDDIEDDIKDLALN